MEQVTSNIKYSKETLSTEDKNVPGPKGRSRLTIWSGITLLSLASLFTFGCGNQITAESTPTPSPTPTPKAVAASVSNLRTHKWIGTNINVTTKCLSGDSTFDIEAEGIVTAGQGNGIWTTLTGNGRTIFVSTNQGGNLSPSQIAFPINDQATSIRGELPIILHTSSATRTYGYEIKAFAAPLTGDKPSFFGQDPIAEVRFATDCR